MQEKAEKRNPYPLKIEGQGNWSVEDTFLQWKILTFSEMRANMSIEKGTTDRRVARILYVSKVTA